MTGNCVDDLSLIQYVLVNPSISSESEECFTHRMQYQCKSLAGALKAVIFEVLWLNTVVLDGFYDTERELAELPATLTADQRNITVLCLETCSVSTEFHFVLRHFDPQLKLRFCDMTFQDSKFTLQNLHIDFDTVLFENVSILDGRPRAGEFGELQLFFFNASFQAPANVTNRLNFQFTFALSIFCQNVVSSGVQSHLNSSFLKLSLAESLFVDSYFEITVARLSMSSISSSKFRCLSANSEFTSVLDIHAEIIMFHMLDSTWHNTTGGVSLTGEKSFFESWLHVVVSGCLFEHNHKLRSGGALYINSYELHRHTAQSYIHIENSRFIANSVERKDFRSVRGGAVAVMSTGFHKVTNGTALFLTIQTASFANNAAEDGGGAVFVAGSGIETKVVDCLFTFTLETSPLKILFILARSDISMARTEFSTAVSNFHDSLFELQMFSPTSEIGVLNIHVKCFLWQKVHTEARFGISPIHGGRILQKVIVKCASCPVSYFIPSDGSYHVLYETNHSRISVNKHVECLPCPSGATCSGDSLTAKSNFWGYEEKKSFAFAQCPPEFCCGSKTDSSCQSYNECANHRTGTLCGECQGNHSMSMMSNLCIPHKNCKAHWFWAAFVVGAFLYMLWYTFKEYTYKIPVIIWQKCRKACHPKYERQQQQDMFYVDKGYFGILIYYVQAVAVLRLSLNVGSNSTLYYLFQHVETYIGLLLSIELTYLPANICPIKNNSMTGKVIVKAAFLLVIFLSWCAIFLFYVLIKILLSQSLQKKFASIHGILIGGLVKIIKYTYGSFTKLMFFSLTCINIAGTKVWFHDGSVECLSSWQKAMIVFAVFYVIPYPITLCAGMKMLEKNSISWIQFLLGTSLPLPFFIYWSLRLLIWRTELHSTHLHAQQVAKRMAAKWQRKVFPKKALFVNVAKTFEVTEERKMFNRFRRGYKDRGGAQYWESIVMFRRLLLSSTILVPYDIIKLGLCCILCILFLIHHVYKHPFIHPLSNKVETLSLTLLCVAALINLVKSFYIQEGISPIGLSVQIIKIGSFVEMTFLPFLLLFILTLEILSTAKCTKHKSV